MTPLKAGKPEPLDEQGIKNLLYYFKKENLERAENAENIVFNYLKSKYPLVADFRFPKELTDWLTEASKKLDNYWGLYWIKQMQGTKFDFLVKDHSGNVFFVDAKSRQEHQLQWGLGANAEQYMRYYELSKYLPFYIYAWVPETQKLYVHKVRNPEEEPKMKKLVSRYGDWAYEVPLNEIQEIQLSDRDKKLLLKKD